MPTKKTDVTAGFHRRRDRCTCKPWVYSQWTTFNYTSYYEAYNDPQHRTKPDPLDETPLPKQYKQRLRPSVVPYWKVADLTSPCGCGIPNPRDVMNKGIAESQPTIPSYSMDWAAKVLQHVGDQYTNIGDSLAEYRATADQFRSYGLGIARAWRAFRNLKKFKGKRITPCSVTSAELAYSFGVAPLVEDLFSSVEALRLALESPIYVDFFQTTTARATQDVSASGYTQFKRKVLASNRVDGTVQLEPVQYANLAFGNPSNWIWELIPFSFVIDWGIPIGQWLQDVDVLRRITSVKGTRSIKEKYVSYWRKVDTVGSQTQLGSWGKLSRQSHERKVLTSIPVPNLPRWKPSLSWHKVYRTLTLLVAVGKPCRKIPYNIIPYR